MKRLGDFKERGDDLSLRNSVQLSDRQSNPLNQSVNFVGISKELNRTKLKELQTKNKGKWTVHNRTNQTMMTWCDNWWDPPQNVRNIRDDNQDRVESDT